MKPSELRIGNWVAYPFGGYQKIRNGQDIDDLFENSASPIPMTPEILEKAGFKKDDGVWKIKSLPCYIFKAAGEEYYISVSVPFKYLHQLQNLYFALTGEELEINI